MDNLIYFGPTDKTDKRVQSIRNSKNKRKRTSLNLSLKHDLASFIVKYLMHKEESNIFRFARGIVIGSAATLLVLLSGVENVTVFFVGLLVTVLAVPAFYLLVFLIDIVKALLFVASDWYVRRGKRREHAKNRG